MWVMVMRCVFKHHVYLCVVSTALMAGLALTSHTSKAYAQAHNCGSSGVVGTVNNEPIVCDGGVTRILNSRSGDIEINMDTGPGKSAGAAVTVRGSGTNITIGKTLKVTGSKGKPVIKVERGGALTLVKDVDVKGVTIKKEIVVDGSESSVTLKGVLKGFDGGEVKVSNEGMIVFEKGVKGIEGMKVKINDGGGMVRFDESVAFNNGEAGIKITGSKGNASVIGMGKTMTVNGTGVGVMVLVYRWMGRGRLM
ncbi:hypothetical protein BBbe_10410 [Bartonella bovis 91-4]|uniref:Right handed beta helix domain-containing protein n=2 Tax=Bartonella bovis TaxID=155194 RepID=N6VBV2_9HYPH|nr:hypothetical protein BBbe_10410 [Bartonella bovis 91-4]